MVKVVSMAKTSTVNHSTPVVHAKLRACCQDLEEWPRSWMGFAEDIPPGEKMVAYFRPFIEHLIGLNLSQKTIRKHVDNLWILGGEIIRGLHETPSLRKKSVEEILDDRIDDEGGPLVYALESEESLQRSLDSTCRKLYRFLRQQPH